ncbi:hypothetical protein FT663_02300 [Candidozyma haemuli var. vulneris]|nr:hypothetical protein FT662_02472 [[Candida] haemuloni var. vulneris]KAF3992373.1 hypothetical protein FT663_02300 [[Candida] haemuloni var. vulneris]
MLIEASVNDKYMKTLSLGSFPSKVLEFQESPDFFQQTVFVDYQLQLLIQHDLGDAIASRKNTDAAKAASEKLVQLKNYISSINANYSARNKSYEESLYYTVVLADLHYLSSEYDHMSATLSSFTLTQSPRLDSQDQEDFVDYLTARFYALYGSGKREGAYKHWLEYLANLRKYGTKSQIAANRWQDTILLRVVGLLSSNGSRPLRFKDILSQTFSENACSITAISSFCLRPENEKHVVKEFRGDFVVFLTELINNKIKQKKDFPDASAETSEEDDFIDSLYEALYDISTQRPLVAQVLKPKLSKKFLVNMTEKTYQSFTVLSNLIRTLLDLEEYDEAIAALKTYIDYVEKDQEQNHGRVNNILDVIDIYTMCIQHFNPKHSMIPSAQESDLPKKFKYTSLYSVVEQLKGFTKQLSNYLKELATVAELRYDEEVGLQDNRLSFLYHRYNTNLVMNDQSKFVRIVSKAWFVMGDLHSYLASHSSPTHEIMKENTELVLKYWKNSLIVNSTGNSSLLFRYALELSYNNLVGPALKLCKFTLKKYPEQFQVWNLFVLLHSAAEAEKASTDNAINQVDDAAVLEDLKKNGSDSSKAPESERFVEDALNIAGLYMQKSHQKGTSISFQKKYSILQLKKTQLAMLEAKHGIDFILDSIAEVFVLYRELFEQGVKPEHNSNQNNNTLQPPHLSAVASRAESKWSHRPSVIDPAVTELKVDKSASREHRAAAKDKIKRLSRVGGDSSTGKTSSKAQQEVQPASKPARRVLQDVWLWAASIYLRLGSLEEAEECIVEAETVAPPNVKTFTFLGLLTSKSRKFLSLQEFERSLEEFHHPEEKFNKKAYGTTLLGMCKLFIEDDDPENSLFISNKDVDAGLIRIKNYLEDFSNCWAYGYNSPELWYYLSTIYEKFDDKLLFNEALWKCVELENRRPVRAYSVCEEWI